MIPSTNVKKMRRRISLDTSCGFSNYKLEDVVHTLRDCPATRYIWEFIFPAGMEDELWGILDGLALLLERKYDSVMIQTDSTEIVLAIQNQARNDLDKTLFRRIHQNLSRIKHWGIQHIRKEDNGETEEIAKLVQEMRKCFQVFEVSR
ncbi:hypothetical protein Gotur_015678 [Gossypium turneri]